MCKTTSNGFSGHRGFIWLYCSDPYAVRHWKILSSESKWFILVILSQAHWKLLGCSRCIRINLSIFSFVRDVKYKEKTDLKKWDKRGYHTHRGDDSNEESCLITVQWKLFPRLQNERLLIGSDWLHSSSSSQNSWRGITQLGGEIRESFAEEEDWKWLMGSYVFVITESHPI